MKYYLLRYTVSNGGYEYPDHTVLQAANDESAQVEADKMLAKEGYLTHDLSVEAIEQNSLRAITKTELAVLKRLRLI